MDPKAFKKIVRRKRLVAKKRLKASTKPIPKTNLRALKRKHKRYDEFMHSPEWKALRAAALERAGYECEALIHHPECLRTEALTCHHLRYTKTLGKELPEDLQVLSKPCHDWVESQKPGLRLWQKVRK